ncbi:hypothetical protein FOZ62_005842, partial [Perkinsus olseni]
MGSIIFVIEADLHEICFSDSQLFCNDIMHTPLLQPLNGLSCGKGYSKDGCWGLTPRSIAELQTAAFTGITVCLTSTTVFSSTISSIFPPQFMILGLAGALIVSYLDL